MFQINDDLDNIKYQCFKLNWILFQSHLHTFFFSNVANDKLFVVISLPQNCGHRFLLKYFVPVDSLFPYVLDRDFSTIRNLVTVIIKSESLRRQSSTSIRKWFSYQFVSKMDPPFPTLKRNAAKGDREINATSVTMPLVRQEIWGHIWKNIIAKHHTNAANVTLQLFMHAVWGHIWKPTLENNCTNATYVTMNLFGQAIWGHIWKLTLEINHTDATNATMHLLRQAIWGHIWKRTLETNPTNAANAVMHQFGQIIWGHIWKHIVGSSNHTNATNTNMQLLRRSLWGHIWKLTLEKNHTDATNVTMHLFRQALWGYIWKLT